MEGAFGGDGGGDGGRHRPKLVHRARGVQAERPGRGYALPMLSLLLPLALAAEPVSLDGNRLVLPGPVPFVTGTAELAPEAGPTLDAAAAWMASKSYVSTVRVEVHTDSQGADEANQALSEARALTVARALVAKGVDCKRLLPVGFGETKPVAENTTAEGRAANRRVELHNAALKGIAIGGMPLDGGGRVAGDPCTSP